MRLIQFKTAEGRRQVGAILENGAQPLVVRNAASVRELALEAARRSASLEHLVLARGFDGEVDYDALIADQRLLLPLDHVEPSRCLISVTGLTHLGSAESRDAMHAKLAAADLSDTMRMFKLGLDGGKPSPGTIGVQPEWAYKGDGSWAVPPEHALGLPSWAEDGGDEAEIVGLYIIGDQGEVLRVGFSLGNEYSDHVMEQRNYLYLAHSKLRQCSYGPEVLLGPLPNAVNGSVRVKRFGSTVWSGRFISGEENMSHSIGNLEHHHFKYHQFRRPGDVHVHFFGASVLSFASGVMPQSGDIFEVEAEAFGRPLRNRMIADEKTELVSVKVL
ncbi:FAH family protein [Bradyrhizobium arachidis]|uniref:AraD1 family protein n=1 Tax=Bradyrhizobium arachidis TaxID=858423 RepID=UPI002163D278|nr:AraD1 family protein [Bradyrhizobium arachidis]UVO35863.1 FAH family protein [Bradyrhizobium arachidis]